MLGVKLKRTGAKRAFATVTVPRIFTCKDGYVTFQAAGGTITRKNRALVDWMEEEGMPNELARKVDWTTFTSYSQSPEETWAIWTSFQPLFSAKTKKELFEQVLSRGFLLAPLFTTQDIVEDEHFRAREVWQTVDHPEVSDKIVYPSAPFKTTGDAIRIRRRAPLIGEHNDEIFQGELGLSRSQITALKEAGVI